jgi:AcrR family transcriptional regulator
VIVGAVSGPARRQTKRRILETSRRLFSERGYHRTTVRDIAEQVGVTDGALYRHFRSKRELLEALLEDAGLPEAYRALAAVPATVPLERALGGMALSALRFMEEHREVLKILILEGVAGDSTVREQYQAVTARWVAGVAQIIEHRAAAEQLPPSIAASLAAQVVAFLWGTFVELLLGACPMAVLDETGAPTAAAREYARSAMRRLLYGLQSERTAG